jgi:hypothetical protein
MFIKPVLILLESEPFARPFVLKSIPPLPPLNVNVLSIL